LTSAVNKHNLRGDRLNEMLEVVDKAVNNEDIAGLGTFLNISSLYLTTGRIYQKTNYRLYATGGSFNFAYEGKSRANDEVEDNKAWDNISWDDEVSTESESGDGWGDDGWGEPVKTKTEAEKKEEAKKEAKRKKESLKQLFIPEQPAVSGPVLKLENVNIAIATNYDSTAIQKTSGQ